jgi:antitoxin PrlF
MSVKSSPARNRYTGKVTSKGQTTVPKEVRDLLGLEEGTQMEWIVDDGKVTVKPRKLRAIDLAGMLGPPPSGVHLTIDEMDDAIGEAVAERFRRKTER